MPEVFVGRQPIYDREQAVVGYEVRLGDAEAEPDGADAGERAARTFLTTFTEIGLDAIVGSRPAFIPFPREFVLHDYPAAFPADRVVVVIPQDTAVDDALVEAVKALARRGYTVALADFVYQEYLHPLLDVADVVRVDVQGLESEILGEAVALLRSYPVRLLAAGVDDRELFERCHDLGFDYFQGAFLCQPDLVRGRRSPANRQAVMLLLAKLQDPEADFQELEEIIGQDVTLSYKLLRFINSAYYALPSRVDSIRQAIALLGTRQLVTWASLVALSGIEDKPRELTVIALVRAKMCELLGAQRQAGAGEGAFVVGLFSVLDALLDSPMPEVLKSLPLAGDITRALLYHGGPLGDTLRGVLAYERGDWDEVLRLGFERRAITEAFLDAISWASTATASLEA